MKVLQIGCLIVWIAACGEPKADIASATTFQEHGVTFELPGNWKASAELESGVCSVEIETPGDTYVSIVVTPSGAWDSLEEYVKLTMSVTKEEAVKGTKLVQEPPTPLAEKDGFQRIRADFVLRALGEKIVFRRTFGFRPLGKKDVHWMTQVAKEDEDKVRGGLDLVLSTLRVAP